MYSEKLGKGVKKDVQEDRFWHPPGLGWPGHFQIQFRVNCSLMHWMTQNVLHGVKGRKCEHHRVEFLLDEVHVLGLEALSGWHQTL